MQILGNYQLFSNKSLSLNYNYKQKNINSQYYIQNVSAYRDFKNAYQGKINKTTFKAALSEEELKSVAKKILDRNVVFGPKEYKSLSKEDLDILREYEKSFRKINRNNEIINDTTEFAGIVSDRIHEKYPNGFIFVSVGRSLACCAKYLEFQGEDVKYCPASGLRGGFYRNDDFKPEFVNMYKRYLDSIGLTKDLAKTTQKPILISDYTYECEGYTLDNFRKLLSLPEIGIFEGDMVKYTPISGIRLFDRGIWIFDYTKDPVYKFHRLKDSWFSSYYNMLANDRMKFYCSVPRFDIDAYMNHRERRDYYAEILNNYYENDNRFEEDFETKMMNFIIAESVRKNASKPKKNEVTELPKTLAEQYRDLGRKLERGVVVFNSDTNRTIVSTSNYTAVFDGELPYQFYDNFGKLEHEEFLEYPYQTDKSLCSTEQKVLFAYPNPKSSSQKEALSRLVAFVYNKN